MTTLKLSQQDSRLVTIETNNRIVEAWIKKSPSRFWFNYEWHYPISELYDVTSFFQSIGEPYTIEPAALALYQEYNSKIEVVRRVKEKVTTEFTITTPTMFKGQLYQYQYEAVTQMLLMRRCLLALQVGMGKAQPLYAKILTPTGFIEMRNARVGMSICGTDGLPQHITGVFPSGRRAVYEFTFTDGARVRSSAEHLWPVHTQNSWKPTDTAQILTTTQIRDKFRVGGRIYMRTTQPIQFTKKKLPIDPYLLGVLLGDGGLSIQDRIRISSLDTPLLTRLRYILRKTHNKLQHISRCDYAIIGAAPRKHGRPVNKLLCALRTLNLMGHTSNTKFIPKLYLTAALKDRIQLLHGLIDTDGSLSKQNTVEFYTTSKQLRDDFIELVRSLGGTTKYSIKRPKFMYKGLQKVGRICYRICILLPHNILPCTLRRKLRNLNPKRKYFPLRRLKDVSYVGQEEVQCISVSAPNNLYITDNFIPTHNTLVSLFSLLKLRELYGGQIRALIVCEAGQIHKPWMETIFKFTDIKDTLIIQGNAEERRQQIAAGKANRAKHWLWLCGYDTIRIDQTPIPRLDTMGQYQKDANGKIIVDTPNLFPMEDWDVICFDEITKLKNVSTKGAKVLREMEAPYIFGLSGTPITNSYFDLYGVMKMINPFIFTNKQNFTDRYLKLDYFGNPKGLLPGAEVELNRKIYPWVRQLLKRDVGKDKPIEVHTIPITLTPAQKNELDLVLRAIADGEKTAFESGVTLRQICNSLKIVTESEPVLDAQGNPTYDNKGELKYKRVLKFPLIPLHESTNKVDELKKLVYNIVTQQKKKVVIFSFFKEMLSIIRQELGKTYKVEVVTGDTSKGCRYSHVEHCNKCPKYRLCSSTKRLIYDFNSGPVNVLLGSDSLSKAQNLHTCDTIINFDLPWSSADLEQRIGRIDRDSNPAPRFFVYNLATLGTIEERIIKIIENKEYESSKVFPKYNVSLSRLSKTIRVTQGATDDLSGTNGGV